MNNSCSCRDSLITSLKKKYLIVALQLFYTDCIAAQFMSLNTS